MTDPCEASKEGREGLPPEELGTTGRYKVTLKLILSGDFNRGRLSK